MAASSTQSRLPAAFTRTAVPARRTAGQLPADGDERLVEGAQRAFHRHGLDPADALLERAVEELDQQQHRGEGRRHTSHEHTLGDGPLGAVGEEEHVADDHDREQDEDDPERRWDDAFRPVDAVDSGSLAVGRVVEPLVEGGLLHRRLGLEGAHGAEELDAPGVDIAHGVPGLRLRPLDVDDGPAVADELATQLCGYGRREELRGLDLTPERKGLLLRAHAGLVVAREREEDDESGQHGKARRQNAEDPGSPVAVGEVAALGARRRTSSIAATAGAATAATISAAQTRFMARSGPVAAGGSLMEARRSSAACPGPR